MTQKPFFPDYLLCNIFLMFAIANTGVSGQPISDIEYRNQPLQDIVASLGQLAGKTVLPDQTVTGSRSFYFSQVDFPTALELVLSSSSLHSWEEAGVIHVSRLLVSANEAGFLTVKGTDIQVDQLVRRLIQRSGTTIVYDTLPGVEITINVENKPLREILEIVQARIPEFDLSDEGGYFTLKRTPIEPAASEPEEANSLTRHNSGLYSLVGTNLQFKATVQNLFLAEGKQFLFLKGTDAVVDRIHVENAAFADLLRILLQAGDADIVEANGVSYVVELNRSELAKQYETIELIRLDHLPVASLPGLFPSGLLSTNNYKLDRERNSIVLNGTETQIAPARAFIAKIDTPVPGLRYHRFELRFLPPQTAIERLPESLKTSAIVALPESRSFVMLVDEPTRKNIEAYLETIDTAPLGIPVRLRYIRAEKLLENLPPSVRAEDIAATNDPQLVFFRGSSGTYQDFLAQLKLIDQPIPQIRYQVLVIQFQEGGSIEVNPQISNRLTGESDDTQFLGAIGNLLSLNFDVVSTFGYTFALDLSAKLHETQARIFADTSLTGLSGQEVSFRNTNTYRYRDLDIDPDTGEPSSTGVVREITSGLFLDVYGWVSGNGMVTMEISTTISKAESSGQSTSAPPGTSERVLTTHVRTQAGTPVIIGGLVQQEESSTERRTPLLGQIPVVGSAFSDTGFTRDNTEMVIYLVPHVEAPEEESDLDSALTAMFHRVYPDL